jgi:hypothetical protein
VKLHLLVVPRGATQSGVIAHRYHHFIAFRVNGESTTNINLKKSNLFYDWGSLDVISLTASSDPEKCKLKNKSLV